jgi:hypothetical protein
MNGNRIWRVPGALVISVAAGLLIANTVSAQPGPNPVTPGSAVCPGPATMGGGSHDAIARALGISNQELWDAQVSGKSIATLALERNIDLATVVDAAVALHTVQLEAAVTAGSLTQAQADVMTAFMKSRFESAFAASSAVGPRGFGMMGGRGMMGSGFGPAPWRPAP